MFKTALFAAATIGAIAISAPASAGQCDRLSGQSRTNCEEGLAEAARYAREAERQERRARTRDILCAADTVGQRASRRTPHGAAYSAGRAVGNVLTGGASSCRRR